jgi:hypothetical protein
VTGEATLYSTLDKANFVFLATAPSSETHEWIVALPAEAEGNLFKYKAASATLYAGEFMASNSRILIDNTSVGTNNTGSGYSWYVDNKTGSTSKTVYSVKNAVSFKVDYNNDSYISNAPTKAAMEGWSGLTTIWSVLGGSGKKFWTRTNESSSYYWYLGNSGWNYASFTGGEYFNDYHDNVFSN